MRHIEGYHTKRSAEFLLVLVAAFTRGRIGMELATHNKVHYVCLKRGNYLEGLGDVEIEDVDDEFADHPALISRKLRLECLSIQLLTFRNKTRFLGLHRDWCTRVKKISNNPCMSTQRLAGLA